MPETPIRYLKGVGPKKEKIFNNLGVYNVRDLLYYFPRRYEDRRSFKNINEIRAGMPALVKGTVYASQLKRMPHFTRGKKVRSIFEVTLGDVSGKINCVWFNQEYLASAIKSGQELVVYGKPYFSKQGFKLVSPEYDFFSQAPSLNLGRIVSMYSLSSTFTQKFMRRVIFEAVNSFKDKIIEPLPFYIRQQCRFPNVSQSLEEIHFPAEWENADKVREKFIFEELFFSQVLVYLRKAKHRMQKGPKFVINQDIFEKIRNNLGFELTDSQSAAIAKITGDLEKSYPMHRLLQGDVGCGKTVVCAFAIAVCASNGWQSAVMVPTEVLVYQHQDTLAEIFKGMKIKIEIVSASLPKAKVKKIYSALEEGKIDVIIGTHALIQQEIKFKNLGLVVIDEQHKFGVAQRLLLPKKSGYNPHCLVMSATPIPRSLALSLYGDLDLSIINELPKGRIAAQNFLVKEAQRAWVYELLKKQLTEGRQAYVVYPVIEESADSDLKSLEKSLDEISKVFSPFRVEMFHGKMKGDEKLKVVERFRAGQTHILVSTTVVEVGVSVDNAAVMLVENPERFGLAQLHQLRGRIQRWKHKPYFILISDNNLSAAAEKRLEVISSTGDGFKIAEEDLKMRGPGDFFGSLQHGLPDLKIADPLRDLELLKLARRYAYDVIKSDPYLEKPQHRCIRQHLDMKHRLAQILKNTDNR